MRVHLYDSHWNYDGGQFALSSNDEIVLQRNPKQLGGFNSLDSVTLTDKDTELRRFFERLREAKRIEVRDGTQRFVVEIKPATVSEEARTLLSKGGPC